MPLPITQTTLQPQSPYLVSTEMLDFESPVIQALIAEQKWRSLKPFDAIGAVYDYVRDQMAFGYNKSDTLKASNVLKDGYGQCNTKGTLLMALLRALGIECRLHGFTIFNALQKGAIPNYLFVLAPKRIIHSWVEVKLNGQWLNLEGYIIDQAYLTQVQATFAGQCQSFSGYGIATPCLAAPNVHWQGQSTYIQKEGIADDFGVYEQPDQFYEAHGTNLSGLKRWLFAYGLRHLMNMNVKRIRQGKVLKSH